MHIVYIHCCVSLQTLSEKVHIVSKQYNGYHPLVTYQLVRKSSTRCRRWSGVGRRVADRIPNTVNTHNTVIVKNMSVSAGISRNRNRNKNRYHPSVDVQVAVTDNTSFYSLNVTMSTALTRVIKPSVAAGFLS